MIRENISSEIKSIPEEQSSVLKGDTPFDTILENVTDQFDEFLSTGYVKKDKTNYIDKMNDAFNLTEQINQMSIDEYHMDYGESIVLMKDLFRDMIVELMNAIGVDLYQIDDPIKFAYILYTNFMLTDQRESFFNYVIRQNVKSSGLETELAIAHGKMLDGYPDEMLHQVEMMFDGSSEINSIMSFLEEYGLSDIIQWIADGFMPLNILYDTFLSNRQSIPYMFIGYIQNEKTYFEKEMV